MIKKKKPNIVWTKKDGKMYEISTLAKGALTFFEFEGLTGTFEEREAQVENNRAEALLEMSKKPSKPSTSDWLFDN